MLLFTTLHYGSNALRQDVFGLQLGCRGICNCRRCSIAVKCKEIRLERDIKHNAECLYSLTPFLQRNVRQYISSRTNGKIMRPTILRVYRSWAPDQDTIARQSESRLCTRTVDMSVSRV